MKPERKQTNDEGLVFYSRFVMHSLDDEQELKFLEILAGCMAESERVYFEFRSAEDAVLDKHFGNHYRRYVDTEVFEERLTRLRVANSI